LHAAATEQKVCVCLALETLLSRDQKVLAERRNGVLSIGIYNIYIYRYLYVCKGKSVENNRVKYLKWH